MKKSLTILLFSLFISPPSLLISAEIYQARYLTGALLEVRAEGTNPAQVRQAVKNALQEAVRLDNTLNENLPSSDISQINQSAQHGPKECSQATMDILIKSNYYWAKTEGAFDVTNGKGTDSIGLEFDLQEGMRKVSLKKSGTKVDLSKIRAGYILDKSARVLKNEGVERATLNFGGQIFKFDLSEKSIIEKVYFSDPLDPEKTLASVALKEGAIFTVSENSFSSSNLNRGPSTSANELGGVTVLAPTAIEAHVYASTLFDLGADQGLSLIKNEPQLCAAFLMVEKTGRRAMKMSEGCEDGQITAKIPTKI